MMVYVIAMWLSTELKSDNNNVYYLRPTKHVYFA